MAKNKSQCFESQGSSCATSTTQNPFRHNLLGEVTQHGQQAPSEKRDRPLACTRERVTDAGIRQRIDRLETTVAALQNHPEIACSKYHINTCCSASSCAGQCVADMAVFQLLADLQTRFGALKQIVLHLAQGLVSHVDQSTGLQQVKKDGQARIQDVQQQLLEMQCWRSDVDRLLKDLQGGMRALDTTMHQISQRPSRQPQDCSWPLISAKDDDIDIDLIRQRLLNVRSVLMSDPGSAAGLHDEFTGPQEHSACGVDHHSSEEAVEASEICSLGLQHAPQITSQPVQTETWSNPMDAVEGDWLQVIEQRAETAALRSMCDEIALELTSGPVTETSGRECAPVWLRALETRLVALTEDMSSKLLEVKHRIQVLELQVRQLQFEPQVSLNSAVLQEAWR